MIIGHVGLADVSGPLRKAERRLSRTINPTTYTADEFTSKVKPNQHFITTVIPHIRDRVQCCPATVQDGSRCAGYRVSATLPATTRRLSKRRSVPKQTGGTHDQRRSHNTKHAAFLLLGPPTALDTHQRGQGVRAHTARPTLRTGLARARRMDWKNGHQTHTGACVRHRRVEADPSQLERCGVLVKWIDMIVCRSPEPRNDRKPAVSSRVD